MKKYVCSILICVLIALSGIMLSACGEKPWMKISYGDLPAHVEQINIDARDNVPGAEKGSTAEIGLVFDFGWEIGTLKFFANGTLITDVTPVPGLEEYEPVRYTIKIKNVKEDIRLSFSGMAAAKMGNINLVLESDDNYNYDSYRFGLYQGNPNSIYGTDKTRCGLTLEELKTEVEKYKTQQIKYSEPLKYEVCAPGYPGFVISEVHYGDYNSVTRSHTKLGDKYITTYNLQPDGESAFTIAVNAGAPNDCLQKNLDEATCWMIEEDEFEPVDAITFKLLNASGKETVAFNEMSTQNMKLVAEVSEEHAALLDFMAAYESNDPAARQAIIKLNDQEINNNIHIEGNKLIVNNVFEPWNYRNTTNGNDLRYFLSISNLQPYIQSSDKWVKTFHYDQLDKPARDVAELGEYIYVNIFHSNDLYIARHDPENGYVYCLKGGTITFEIGRGVFSEGSSETLKFKITILGHEVVVTVGEEGPTVTENNDELITRIEDVQEKYVIIEVPFESFDGDSIYDFYTIQLLTD